MNTALELRVSRLENATRKLGEANQLTTEVVTELVTELSETIKEQVKDEIVTRGKEIETKVITTISGAIDSKIGQQVRGILDERGLSKADADRLTKARYKRMRELLGDSHSDEYKLFISFYQGCLRNAYYRKFNVMRYADINPSQFKEALEFIQNFDIKDRTWCEDVLHETYRNNEFTDIRQLHRYERYFRINA